MPNTANEIKDGVFSFIWNDSRENGYPVRRYVVRATTPLLEKVNGWRKTRDGYLATMWDTAPTGEFLADTSAALSQRGDEALSWMRVADRLSSLPRIHYAVPSNPGDGYIVSCHESDIYVAEIFRVLGYSNGKNLWKLFPPKDVSPEMFETILAGLSMKKPGREKMRIPSDILANPEEKDRKNALSFIAESLWNTGRSGGIIAGDRASRMDVVSRLAQIVLDTGLASRIVVLSCSGKVDEWLGILSKTSGYIDCPTAFSKETIEEVRNNGYQDVLSSKLAVIDYNAVSGTDFGEMLPFALGAAVIFDEPQIQGMTSKKFTPCALMSAASLFSIATTDRETTKNISAMRQYLSVTDASFCPIDEFLKHHEVMKMHTVRGKDGETNIPSFEYKNARMFRERLSKCLCFSSPSQKRAVVLKVNIAGTFEEKVSKEILRLAEKECGLAPRKPGQWSSGIGRNNPLVRSIIEQTFDNPWTIQDSCGEGKIASLVKTAIPKILGNTLRQHTEKERVFLDYLATSESSTIAIYVRTPATMERLKKIIGERFPEKNISPRFVVGSVALKKAGSMDSETAVFYDEPLKTPEVDCDERIRFEVKSSGRKKDEKEKTGAGKENVAKVSPQISSRVEKNEDGWIDFDAPSM